MLLRNNSTMGTHHTKVVRFVSECECLVPHREIGSSYVASGRAAAASVEREQRDKKLVAGAFGLLKLVSCSTQLRTSRVNTTNEARGGQRRHVHCCGGSCCMEPACKLWLGSPNNSLAAPAWPLACQRVITSPATLISLGNVTDSNN